MDTRKIRNRTIAAGVGTTAIGALTCVADHWLYGVSTAVTGLAATGAPIYLGLRSTRTRAQINRHDRHSDRNAGTASWLDVARSSSRLAMYRRAGVIRPSLRHLGAVAKLRVPALTYATPLAKVGRQTVYLTREDSSIWVGPPGTGKTAGMAGQVIDAPGGVLVTSTAADIYEDTAPLRERPGCPVWVFNPSGLAGIRSTLRWSPLSGCEDPATAVRRATDMIPQVGELGSEGERWAAQGRRVLGIWLHAAALGGYRMSDVATWATNPEVGKTQILTALTESPRAAQMCRDALGVITMNPKTRDGVMLPVAAALAWVAQPSAAAVGDHDGADGFTVEQLVDQRGSLYLLGDTDGTTAPLIAALTAEVVHRARAIAARRPGSRLDPGLTLVLDEVALICPVPLDRWLAELRKWSIAIHAACQGAAQLRQRWGDNGASMILTSATAVLVFGGCKDPADLELFGQLTGTREVDGERLPVVSSAMLAGLPNHRALLIRRGMPPALATTPKVWRRRDVRSARSAAARVIRTAEKTTARQMRAARKCKTAVNA